MSKYYPILDDVSDAIDLVPHPKATAISKAIRVCNDRQTETFPKLHAIARVILI